MALTQTPRHPAVRAWVSADTDVSNTPVVNIRFGKTSCGVFELTGGTSISVFKFFDHNGGGFSAGSTAPNLILPVAATGQSTYRITVDGAPYPFKNGLTYAVAQELGKALTTDPGGTPVCRMKGRDI